MSVADSKIDSSKVEGNATLRTESRKVVKRWSISPFKRKSGTKLRNIRKLAYQRKDHEDPGHLLAEQFDEFLYSEDESNLEEVNEFWMNFDGEKNDGFIPSNIERKSKIKHMIDRFSKSSDSDLKSSKDTLFSRQSQNTSIYLRESSYKHSPTPDQSVEFQLRTKGTHIPKRNEEHRERERLKIQIHKIKTANKIQQKDLMIRARSEAKEIFRKTVEELKYKFDKEIKTLKEQYGEQRLEILRKDIMISKLSKLIINQETTLCEMRGKTNVEKEHPVKKKVKNPFQTRENTRLKAKEMKLEEDILEYKFEIEELKQENEFMKSQVSNIQNICNIYEKDMEEAKEKSQALEAKFATVIRTHEDEIVDLREEYKDEIIRLNQDLKSRKKEFKKFRKKSNKEFHIRETIQNRQAQYIETLKKELVLAKNIIKNPRLFRKAHGNINILKQEQVITQDITQNIQKVEPLSLKDIDDTQFTLHHYPTFFSNRNSDPTSHPTQTQPKPSSAAPRFPKKSNTVGNSPKSITDASNTQNIQKLKKICPSLTSPKKASDIPSKERRLSSQITKNLHVTVNTLSELKDGMRFQQHTSTGRWQTEAQTNTLKTSTQSHKNIGNTGYIGGTGIGMGIGIGIGIGMGGHQQRVQLGRNGHRIQTASMLGRQRDRNKATTPTPSSTTQIHVVKLNPSTKALHSFHSVTLKGLGEPNTNQRALSTARSKVSTARTTNRAHSTSTRMNSTHTSAFNTPFAFSPIRLDHFFF